MTTEEAYNNIGKPFKYQHCVHWDVIKEVSGDGYITGEFLCVPAEDCRLKQEQPPQLKKSKKNNEIPTDS